MRRVAQSKLAHRRLIDAARFQVLQGLAPFRVSEEQRLIIDRGALVGPVKLFPFSVIPGSAPVLFHRDAVALGYPFHGLGEGQMIVVHQEMKNTAAGLATEAMVDAFFFAYRERWRLLGVKWTKPEMIAAGLLEGYVIGNDLDNRGAMANLSDFFLADHFLKLKLSWRRSGLRLEIIAGKNLFLAEADKTAAQFGQRPGEIGALHIGAR